MHPTLAHHDHDAPQRTELTISGMTCASCVARVEKALKRAEGVDDSSVNFATNTATVTHHGADTAALVTAVEMAGYGATLIDHHDHAHHNHAAMETADELKALNHVLLLAAVLTVPVVALSMGWHMRPMAVNVLIAALSTVVIFWCGRRFFVSTWQAARHFSTTMDTLVALGSTAAWGLSMFGLIAHWGNPMAQSESLYFETGAVIVTLILLGKLLEATSKGKMSSAIDKLMGLTPKTVLMVKEDGTEMEMPVEHLKPGDRVRIRPGERIAADGTVAEGTSFVDEAMLTGEPLPVEKKAESLVTGGTLNGNGSLLVVLSYVGEETVLAHIVQAVQRAQGTKAPMQKLADKVSAIFVPAVIGIALLTVVVSLAFHVSLTMALLRAVSVLVIACPCALGLATPTALMVGIGRGAETGLLIKDGHTLELAEHIHTVLFDKTGTLTIGKPELRFTKGLNGVTDEEALRVAASLEAASEHPLARAVVAAATSAKLASASVTGFEAVPGEGVRGMVEGTAYSVVSSAKHPMKDADEYLAQGLTVSVLLSGETPIGLFAIGDEVRPDAAAAVSALTALGVKAVMVTGDNPVAANAMAKAVGIAAVEAGILPEGKAAIVARYQSDGLVAMVGDGMNDAPALAQADVGIAMGGGNDIALETAAIAVLGNRIEMVPQAIRLSRATMGIIRGNLVWAFGYNVVLIPLAALGFMNPMIAAGAMALSSVSVVLNSLRLRGFR